MVERVLTVSLPGSGHHRRSMFDPMFHLMFHPMPDRCCIRVGSTLSDTDAAVCLPRSVFLGAQNPVLDQCLIGAALGVPRCPASSPESGPAVLHRILQRRILSIFCVPQEVDCVSSSPDPGRILDRLPPWRLRNQQLSDSDVAGVRR